MKGWGGKWWVSSPRRSHSSWHNLKNFHTNRASKKTFYNKCGMQNEPYMKILFTNYLAKWDFWGTLNQSQFLRSAGQHCKVVVCNSNQLVSPLTLDVHSQLTILICAILTSSHFKAYTAVKSFKILSFSMDFWCSQSDLFAKMAEQNLYTHLARCDRSRLCHLYGTEK